MTESSLKQVKILDVNISSATDRQVLSYVQKKIQKQDGESKFYIVTPNPEQVLLAQEDELFKSILNRAQVSIPDGIGLVAAYKYNSLPRPAKIIKRILVLLKQGVQVGLSVVFDQKWLQKELTLIKGRKLFEDFILLCARENYSAVLVGDDKLSAQKAAARLREKYPGLLLHAMTGPSVDSNGVPKKNQIKVEEKVIISVKRIKPVFLFIGFGAPKQEKWLYRMYNKLDFGCAMVVGSTFDYVSGTRKSVPKWVEDYNFEWLFRLLTGSQKPARVFAAFPQFAFRVFLNKLIRG